MAVKDFPTSEDNGGGNAPPGFHVLSEIPSWPLEVAPFQGLVDLHGSLSDIIQSLPEDSAVADEWIAFQKEFPQTRAEEFIASNPSRYHSPLDVIFAPTPGRIYEPSSNDSYGATSGTFDEKNVLRAHTTCSFFRNEVLCSECSGPSGQVVAKRCRIFEYATEQGLYSPMFKRSTKRPRLLVVVKPSKKEAEAARVKAVQKWLAKRKKRGTGYFQGSSEGNSTKTDARLGVKPRRVYVKKGAKK